MCYNVVKPIPPLGTVMKYCSEIGGTDMELTKIRLLRILEILRETDEDHPYTAQQLKEKLSLYGIAAERKAILRDVAAL